jgi:hypothetical protein
MKVSRLDHQIPFHQLEPTEQEALISLTMYLLDTKGIDGAEDIFFFSFSRCIIDGSTVTV